VGALGPDLAFSCPSALCLRDLADAARRTRTAAHPRRHVAPQVVAASATPWVPGLDRVGLGAGVALGALVAYLLLRPLKDTAAARLSRGALEAAGLAARRRSAHVVQTEINEASDRCLANARHDLLEGPLSLRFRRGSPSASLRAGRVAVSINRSGRHPTDVLAALMTYLPEALIPTARDYVAEWVMRAVDLTFATMLLAAGPATRDAGRMLSSQKGRERARNAELSHRIDQVDMIDLHGWLLRIMLPELKRVGEALSPGVATPGALAESEGFVDWLHLLAVRRPGDSSTPLVHTGRDFRIGLVMIGDHGRMAREGTRPHRRRAERNMYEERLDAVYLIARGRRTIARARAEVFARLRARPGVYRSGFHEYRLRPDFHKRIGIRRSRAMVAYLWMRPRAREFSRLHLPIRVQRLPFSVRLRRRGHSIAAVGG
jgi:hypothetical protein